MPDHLHVILQGQNDLSDIWQAMVDFKQHTGFWFGRRRREFAWQKDFFDRQLRSGESYRQKWLYLWQNPIVAKFCAQPEQWPWQGELNVLRWHEPAT